MTYRLFLTEVATGVKREVAQEDAWGGEDDGVEYVWTDGNYGCNCNRDLFFRRAAGEPDGEHMDCGEGAFLLAVQAPDGSTIYDEAKDA